MAVSKFRIRFRKAGDLRFLSHHDLMRAFERMLRRAALPFKSTEGFHPKPKMMFASALALGIVGQQEVIEIEFDGELQANDVLERLSAQAPPGLELLSVRMIEPKVKAQACRATYRIELSPDLLTDVPERLAAIEQQPHCWVERAKPQPRRIDIRPFLAGFEIDDNALAMTFIVTPQGTARPEEVLRLLGLEEQLLNGAVLERTVLELIDESSDLEVSGSAFQVSSTEVKRLLRTSGNGSVCLSSEGAAVVSQGREPLECVVNTERAPEGRQ